MQHFCESLPTHLLCRSIPNHKAACNWHSNSRNNKFELIVVVVVLQRVEFRDVIREVLRQAHSLQQRMDRRRQNEGHQEEGHQEGGAEDGEKECTSPCEGPSQARGTLHGHPRSPDAAFKSPLLLWATALRRCAPWQHRGALCTLHFQARFLSRRPHHTLSQRTMLRGRKVRDRGRSRHKGREMLGVVRFLKVKSTDGGSRLEGSACKERGENPVLRSQNVCSIAYCASSCQVLCIVH